LPNKQKAIPSEKNGLCWFGGQSPSRWMEKPQRALEQPTNDLAKEKKLADKLKKGRGRVRPNVVRFVIEQQKKGGKHKKKKGPSKRVGGPGGQMWAKTKKPCSPGGHWGKIPYG